MEWVSPNLVRLIAGGEGLANFEDNGMTDAYVKILFPDPALGLEPPYDMAALRETLPREQIPVTRTYTVRWFDAEKRQLALDFVIHGDSGIAAPWAAGAKPEDRFAFMGPGGAYAPADSTSWHIFVGDHSALPAIAAAIERLPEGAQGVAHIELTDARDIIDIETPASIQLNWLINADTSDIEFLARALEGGKWGEAAPSGTAGVFVFAHGERESIKAVRRVLSRRGIPREQLSISGYWARGRAEDVFQAEKRLPIGRIEEDAA
ncbi:MAG TPA: siderophore-interacting protein [Actinomycetaceae bacterium]|nr:siderophore-interacting protein [Actinomycetaceae bacterium]